MKIWNMPLTPKTIGAVVVAIMTVAGSAASIIVVPEVRQWLHLDPEPVSQKDGTDATRGKVDTSKPEHVFPEKKVAHTKPSSPSYENVINESALAGSSTVNAVAIKGDAYVAQEILVALAVPLKKNVFTPAFTRQGLFDRALQGDGSAIAGLALPQKLDKIVLLSVGEPQKSKLPEVDGALRLRQQVQIAVVAARSGAVLKTSRFTAEGVGFNDDFIRESFNEDLAKKLEPLKQVF